MTATESAGPPPGQGRFTAAATLRHPAVRRVFVTFGAAALLLAGTAAALADHPATTVAAGLGYGLAWWSLLEYLLHRYMLHWEPQAPGWQAVRRRLPGHRSHHDGPQDPDDVVTTKHGVALPLSGLGILAMLAVGFTLPFALATIAGAALGYAAYEFVHFACHQMPMAGWPGRALRRHHAIHHHRDETVNFGVTSPIWDHVFGTAFRPGATPPQGGR